MPHFGAATRENIVVGSHVIGVSRAIEGWIGTVKKITGEALNRKFFIDWHNHDNLPEEGEEYACYAKRSFKLYSSRDAANAPRASLRARRPPRPPGVQPSSDEGEGGGAAALDDDDEVGDEASGSASDGTHDNGDDDGGDDGDAVAGGAPPPALAPGVGVGAPANIVQVGPWDPGFRLVMERKVRGAVVDRTNWTVKASIGDNLHRRVHAAPTTFNWAVIGKTPHCHKTEYDYWLLACPEESLRQEVLCTNANIDAANDAAVVDGAAPTAPIARTSMGETIRKHGLRLAMTLTDCDKPTSWFWAVDGGGDRVVHPPAFGSRFGMSRNRFMLLEQHEQFCPQPPDAASDPWWKVRQLVQWFNARRAAIMKPGVYVCEDESGSWWYGADAEKLPDWLNFRACPHVTFLQKKPKDHFIEFKNLCDVLSGVMIMLEIQEGEQPMRQQLFCTEYPAHIAMSLRLLQKAGLLGSWRVLIADAAFGSVSACKALLAHGMLSMMIVKQAHAMYPIKEIRAWAATKDPKHNQADKGSTLIYGAEVSVGDDVGDGSHLHHIAAIGYIHQNVRTIVSSFGCCTLGGPVYEERKALVQIVGAAEGEYEIVTEKREIPCPSNVGDMIAGFGAIDQHNGLRQGILKMEYQKKTIHWWKRVATTLDGMHITDAFKVMCFDMEKAGQQPPFFKEFCDKLAHQLIYNVHLQGRTLRPNGGDAANPDEHVLASVMALGKRWSAMEDGGKKNKDVRGYCRICKKKTAYWCQKCSIVSQNDATRSSIVYLCNPAKQQCFYAHVKDPETQ